MLSILVAAALLAGAQRSPPLTPPRPAPAVFVTSNHGLTFHSPPGARYCPLPKGWVGSDHGTELVLAGGQCAPAGYPSSGRTAESTDTALIAVFYGHDVDEGEDEPRPRPPCDKVAAVRLLGAERPVCRRLDEGRDYYEVAAKYRADGGREAIVSLYTTPARLEADLETLRAFAATVQACRTEWMIKEHVGAGAPCPKDGRFF